VAPKVLSKPKRANLIENARKSDCERKFGEPVHVPLFFLCEGGPLDRTASRSAVLHAVYRGIAQTLHWAKLYQGLAKAVKAHPGTEAVMRSPHAPG
jgi:hypothetical protein